MPTDVNQKNRLCSFRIGGGEIAMGVVGLVLALFILLVSLLRVSALRVSAMETTSSGYQVEAVKTEPRGRGKIPEEVDAKGVVETGGGEAIASESGTGYQLAYPGMLPDSKLYWLKMVRDRVWSWLISGDKKKAEFFLLMADKRWAAASRLVDKGKPELGAVTAAKAARYYQRAVEQALKLEGGERERMLTRLDAAGSKHEEVMWSLEQRLPITAEGAWGLAKNTLREAFETQLRPKLDEIGGQLEKELLSPVPIKKSEGE